MRPTETPKTIIVGSLTPELGQFQELSYIRDRERERERETDTHTHTYTKRERERRFSLWQAHIRAGLKY